MAERQHELDQITRELKAASSAGVEQHPGNIREFVTRRLADLLGLLKVDTFRARAELLKHTQEVKMIPQKDEDGRRTMWLLVGGT